MHTKPMKEIPHIVKTGSPGGKQTLWLIMLRI